MTKTIKVIFSVLLLLNGLFFVSNIYVIGDRKAAIEMHNDLFPNASAFVANAKVIVCFVTGILYLLAAYGLLRNKSNFVISGIMGAIVFIGFYIIELILWGRSHPRVWIDFSIFGGLSLIYGIYSLITLKRSSL